MSVERPRSDRFLAVLCDVMGGHRDGDVASKLVAEHICTYWKRNQSQDDSLFKISSACRAAMIALNAKSSAEMGTTMAMVCINDGEALFVHCGDSRIYHIRRNKIIYRSVDHISFTPEGWQIISRAFYTGTDSYLPEIYETTLLSDDRIFVCSDGIYGVQKRKNLKKCYANNCSIDSIKALAASPAHYSYSRFLIDVM